MESDTNILSYELLMFSPSYIYFIKYLNNEWNEVSIIFIFAKPIIILLCVSADHTELIGSKTLKTLASLNYNWHIKL